MQTRLQFKSPSGRRLYRSNVDVVRKTVARHGWTGLYAGLEGQVVKGFLSEGVKMVIKDRLEQMIVVASGRVIRSRQSAAT